MRNRFYFACGKKGYRPTSELIWYDLETNQWEKTAITVERCNPMLALITPKLSYNRKSFLLIAGGFDLDNKAIKSW
jgi:hypothetical protein